MIRSTQPEKTYFRGAFLNYKAVVGLARPFGGRLLLINRGF